MSTSILSSGLFIRQVREVASAAHTTEMPLWMMLLIALTSSALLTESTSITCDIHSCLTYKCG